MAEQSEPKNFPLSQEEVGWVIRAFLSHPDRKEKGAKEEEIIEVIKWCAGLKIDTMINLGVLYEVYSGNISLDLHEDGQVYMSVKDVADQTPPRDPLKYLDVETLIELVKTDG